MTSIELTPEEVRVVADLLQFQIKQYGGESCPICGPLLKKLLKTAKVD